MPLKDDPTHQRRIAIVTYFFPPLGGVGVQRMLKHATYLTRFGWRPVIFTPRNPAYEIKDPSLAKTVPPDLDVHRSFILEPIRMYWWLASLGSRASSRLRVGRREGARVDVPARETLRVKHEGERMRRLWLAVGRIVFFPDQQLAWVPFAVRSIRAAARDRPFDAVMSSSPPVTTHLVAGLARRPGATWVADFRDPWIGNPFAPELPWLHRRLMVKIEGWIVRRADLCLFATPSLRQAYANRYPDLADRFVTLTNGYDRNDLPAQVEPVRTDREHFRIVYAGSLYREKELEVFLEGLRRLLDRRPEFRDRLRVEFVGWLSRANQEVADRAAGADGLAGIVSYRGFRPRDEAIAAVAAADACLLIVGDDPGKGVALPGKLFEYLGLDRQVLAVVPPGDVEQILQQLDWGVVVRPEPDAIARGIEQITSDSRRSDSADPAGRFDRVALSAQLAALLDRPMGRDGVGEVPSPDAPRGTDDA